MLAACQDQNPLPQPEPQLKPLNEIGKKWTYEYSASDSTEAETMIVEVIGDHPDQIIPMNRSANSMWFGSYCTDTSTVLSQGAYEIAI